MGLLIKQVAEIEKNWGALIRWGTSIVFFLVLYSTLHFADLRYVNQTSFNARTVQNEMAFNQINAKLDTVILGQATVAQHVIDIQRQLDHSGENRAEKQPAQTADFARQ